VTPPAAALAEAPVRRRPGPSRHRNYPLTTSRRAQSVRDGQFTRHERVEPGSFVLRPGGPVEGRKFPGSLPHRPRPNHARCDDPRVVTRAAALRRRHVLLAVVAVGLVLLLAGPLGGRGSASDVASGPAPAATALSPHSVYVVHPGDTLWSIAERLVPQGDPRPAVAALAREVGQDTVRPGEKLLLP
jgi:LysM repeat protein